MHGDRVAEAIRSKTELTAELGLSVVGQQDDGEQSGKREGFHDCAPERRVGVELSFAVALASALLARKWAVPRAKKTPEISGVFGERR